MTDSGSTVPSPESQGQPPPGYPRRPVPPPPPAPAPAPGPGEGSTQALPVEDQPAAPPPGRSPVPPAHEPPPLGRYQAAPAGYHPGTGYQPAGPGYQPSAPGYQAPVSSGYQSPSGPPGPSGTAGASGPGYPPPGPAYQPTNSGFDPAPPGYQPPAPWGPAAGYSRSEPQVRRMPSLAGAPPHLLGALAISAGIVVLFFSNLLIAVGQPTGTPGNIRLLQFLVPADLAVGAILMLAVALVALARRVSAPAVPAGAPPELAPGTVRTVVGGVAAFVTLAALVRAITVLTISHQHGAVKLGNMFDALAAVLVAGVAAFWALEHR